MTDLSRTDFESKARRWTAVGAILMATGVAFGAFGAHALRPYRTDLLMAAYTTGVLYHLIHALAVLIISALTLAGVHTPTFFKVTLLFTISICLFSGSLYLLVILNLPFLGAITPLGGLGFICGWLWLGIHLLRN